MSVSICRVMLALCTALVACRAFPYRFGVVTPGDPFLFVGDDLILYCNITNADLREDSSKLGFERTSEYDAPYIIPKGYITIVTSKTIRLRIPDLTLEDNGNYPCFQTTIGKRNRTIGHQVVRVDHRPKRVEKIDCLVYNWRNMTCNWTLGVDFKYPDHVSVRLVWTIDGRQQDCPELTNSSCRWPSDVYQSGATYYMRVIVRTMKFGNREEIARADSPQFTVDTSLYVKPAPIRDFQAWEETSTCIRLSWKHPSPRKREKSFVGMYQKAGTNQWNKINAEFIISKDPNFSWRSIRSHDVEDIDDYRISCFVCDLNPFTSYNFKVSVLPYPEGSGQMKRHGHRSEWISVPAKTREDVPGISPPLCPSCFYLHPCDRPKDDQRCVRLYWGETPSPQRHGIFRNYFLRFVTKNSTVPDIMLSPNVTHADVTIPDESCEIHLTASTSKGQSLVSSVINIPADTAIAPPTPRNFLVQTDAHQMFPLTYYLSWDPLPSDTMSRDTNVTIVWCTAAGSVYDLCKDNIHWKSLSRDYQNYTLVPELSETFNGRINIGIATTETSDGATPISSGLKWTSCIYHRNQKPERMPENMRFARPSPTGGLTVRWDKPDCATEKAFVQSYKVRICVTEDGETCANGESAIIRQTQQSEYTFKNELEPMVRYMVSVAAITPYGTGPWSLPRNATVEPVMDLAPGDDFDLITVIVVISVILLAIIVFVVIKCVCCCMERANRTKSDFRNLNPRAESKQPLNQPSRFQDRPLPEPPTAALHYYGLNACMTNLGSSEGSSGSSYDSVNSNQAQPLIGGKDNAGPVDAREYNYLLPVHERGSSSSSGVPSGVGGSTKSSSTGNSGGGVIYSKGQTISFMEPYSKMAQDSGSGFKTGSDIGSGSEINYNRDNDTDVMKRKPSEFSGLKCSHPSQKSSLVRNNTDYLQGSTPITTPDSAVDLQEPPQWLPDQGDTLPLRKVPPQPKSAECHSVNNCFNIGRINDEPDNSIHSQRDDKAAGTTLSIETTLLAAGLTPSAPTETVAPEPPSSSPPPVPSRQPLKDKPPLNHAPPPPLSKKTKRSPHHRKPSASRSQHSPYAPNNETGHNLVNPSSNPNTNPIKDCDDSKLQNSNEFNPSSFGNDEEGALPSILFVPSNTSMPPSFSFEPDTDIGLQLQSFTFPPPPSSPPSPDPSSQHTGVLASPQGGTPPLAHGTQLTTATSTPNWWTVPGNIPVIDPADFLNHDNNDKNNDNSGNHHFNPSDENSDASSPAILNLNQPQPTRASTIEDPYQPNSTGVTSVDANTPTTDNSVTRSSATPSSTANPNYTSHLPNNNSLFSPTEHNGCFSPPTHFNKNTNVLCDEPIVVNPNYIQCSQVPLQQCPPSTNPNTKVLCDEPIKVNPNYVQCSQVSPQKNPLLNLPSQNSFNSVGYPDSKHQIGYNQPPYNDDKATRQEENC